MLVEKISGNHWDTSVVLDNWETLAKQLPNSLLKKVRLKLFFICV